MMVPKDVMASAMRALMVMECDMVQSVAKAILTERKRCAAIARAEMLNKDDYDACNYDSACENVAMAIEAGA